MIQSISKPCFAYFLIHCFSEEVTRVTFNVGIEGKLGGQAQVTGVGGIWKDLTDNVNTMAQNLTIQVRAIAEVTKAVARGDLSKKIEVDVKGEILELKNTINTMVDQLGTFAAEVKKPRSLNRNEIETMFFPLMTVCSGSIQRCWIEDSRRS